jgi:hypothetical protein
MLEPAAEGGGTQLQVVDAAMGLKSGNIQISAIRRRG